MIEITRHEENLGDRIVYTLKLDKAEIENAGAPAHVLDDVFEAVRDKTVSGIVFALAMLTLAIEEAKEEKDGFPHVVASSEAQGPPDDPPRSAGRHRRARPRQP